MGQNAWLTLTYTSYKPHGKHFNNRNRIWRSIWRRNLFWNLFCRRRRECKPRIWCRRCCPRWYGCWSSRNGISDGLNDSFSMEQQQESRWIVLYLFPSKIRKWYIKWTCHCTMIFHWVARICYLIGTLYTMTILYHECNIQFNIVSIHLMTFNDGIWVCISIVCELDLYGIWVCIRVTANAGMRHESLLCASLLPCHFWRIFKIDF